ncbi:hypothetical protein M8494_14925 [Serratia ureilytica]
MAGRHQATPAAGRDPRMAARRRAAGRLRAGVAPPHEMLANRRDLKAVFALGAGVDAILDQERKHPARCLPACRCCGWRIPAWRSRCRNTR